MSGMNNNNRFSSRRRNNRNIDEGHGQDDVEHFHRFDSETGVQQVLNSAGTIINSITSVSSLQVGLAARKEANTNATAIAEEKRLREALELKLNGLNAVYPSGDFKAQSGTASTTCETGALVVAGGVGIKGSGVNICSTANVDIDVITGGAGAKDLILSVTGGGDSSLLLSSSGTGADAISIDATAGSMVIAPNLIDGKTLKIGPAASTQMVFTPHGTPATEKISITNATGTDAASISLTSTAGGITNTYDSTNTYTITDDNGTATSKNSLIFTSSATAGDQKIALLNGSGTAADSISLTSTAGGITLTSTAGDITNTYDSAKTYTITDDNGTAGSKNSLIFTSSATAGDQKIALLNGSGTAADSISLTSTAGGITLNGSTGVVFGSATIETFTVTDTDTQSATLAAAEILKGLYVHTSVTGAGTFTTPTATQIVSGCNLTADNQCISLYYINDGDQVVTLTAGTGVTVADAGQTIAANESAKLIFRRTGTSAVTVYSVGA
jgi:hypothetical protein